MKITIIRDCSEFLKQSNGKPLVKFLPKEGPDQRKIKVRKRKTDSKFDKVFNTVFSQHPDLRQRAVFCSGASGLREEDAEADLEPFYVFPPDGFKYIYSPNVYRSSIQYQDTLDRFLDVMGENAAIETFKEVLKYDYIGSNLIDGIGQGCEIIVYNVPYFFAIRTSSVNKYSTLFSL
jgi:hypothetical protein